MTESNDTTETLDLPAQLQFEDMLPEPIDYWDLEDFDDVIPGRELDS